MNAPSPAEVMRALFLNCGPIAHLDDGSSSPLAGRAMCDADALVHQAGMGILLNDGVITRFERSDVLEEEYSVRNLGQTNRLTKLSAEAETEAWDCGGLAIIPGLIDSHTHLLWAGERSQEVRWRQLGLTYAEISAKGGGIAHTVQATRDTSLSGLIELGRNRLRNALSFGTTYMEVKSGYGLDTRSELQLLEAAHLLSTESDLPSLDLTWLGAHDFPPRNSGGRPTANEREEYVAEIISKQLPAILEQGYARSADVFCEPGWFQPEQTEYICQEASAGGLRIRLHVDEFVDGGGLALAAELGADTADHAYHSSHKARELANNAGTMQGFLPGTPHALNDPMPPMQECIENHWKFTIATDFNPNCQTLSLPFIGSLAVQRGGVDPLAALVACTRNAASTLPHPTGLKHGIISEGSIASFNILSSSAWESWSLKPGGSPVLATVMEGNTPNIE